MCVSAGQVLDTFGGFATNFVRVMLNKRHNLRNHYSQSTNKVSRISG